MHEALDKVGKATITTAVYERPSCTTSKLCSDLGSVRQLSDAQHTCAKFDDAKKDVQWMMMERVSLSFDPLKFGSGHVFHTVPRYSDPV